MELRDILATPAMKYDGELVPLINALVNNERIDTAQFEAFKAKLKYNYVTLIDDNYPEILKHVENPPIVLFYKGNLDLINFGHQIIAKESDEGLRMLHVIDPELTPRGIKMNYVMACECHDDMYLLMSKMHEAQEDLNQCMDFLKSRANKEKLVH